MKVSIFSRGSNSKISPQNSYVIGCVGRMMLSCEVEGWRVSLNFYALHTSKNTFALHAHTHTHTHTHTPRSDSEETNFDSFPNKFKTLERSRMPNRDSARVLNSFVLPDKEERDSIDYKGVIISNPIITTLLK